MANKMKNTGNYIRGLAFLTLCLVGTAPVHSVSEFSRSKKPTPAELAIINSIKQEIYEEKAIIEQFYLDLKEKDRIDPSSQSSTISMKAEKHIYYGEKKRYLYNEAGVIQWNGESVAAMDFKQRRGETRSGNLLKKRIRFDFPADPASMNINMIVIEHLTSGEGDKINFRFPPDTVGDEGIRDSMEEVTVDGIPMKMMVVYIRNVDSRIEILRECLDLMKLVRRRVDWMVRSDAAQKARRVQQLLDATHF